MTNVKLVIEYDGTAYHGFQVQPGLRTIQAELEQAILAVTGEAVRVAGAGRTDAGVHATGQVVSFKSHSRLSERVLMRALNATLPDDVAVTQCAFVAPEFHARFSAKSREYRYTILNREAPTALERHFVYHYRRPLNTEDMQKASDLLVGRHDFASFARTDPVVASTVRTVVSAVWRRDGDWLYFSIVANGFLPQMVRGIVGTLIWVGIQKIDVRGFQEIIHGRDRRIAGPTVPARGLCFVGAEY